MVLWALAIAAAGVPPHSKARMSPKLMEAEHRFQLGHEQNMKEFEAAERRMSEVGVKAAADEDRFEQKEEQLREHAAAKLERSEDAFEASLKKTEESNKAEADALVAKYEDHMRGVAGSHFRHRATSYLETAADSKTGDSDAAASQQILAEARDAARTKLGDGLRDFLQETKDSRAAAKRRLDDEEKASAERLLGLRNGMRKEEAKLKEFKDRIAGEHKYLDRTMQAEDLAYARKLDRTEQKIETENREREQRFEAREKKETDAFRHKEEEQIDMIEDAFHLPRN